MLAFSRRQYLSLLTLLITLVAPLTAQRAPGHTAAPVAMAPATADERYMQATLAWAEGNYPSALEQFAALLASPDAESVRERIALFTGEKWHTSLVAENARAPRWSPDGAYAAMDITAGSDRFTRIVRTSDGQTVADIRGMNLVFSPDGQRVAYTASTGAITERVIATGAETVRPDSGLFKAQLLYAADGRTIYTLASHTPGGRSEIYAIDASGPKLLVSADSSIADLQIVPGANQLVYAIGGRSPIPGGGVGGRGDAAGGAGGGGGFGRGPRTRFAVFDVSTRSAREFQGEAPVIAAKGSALAFIRRAAGVNILQRLQLAPLGTPIQLHGTTDSLANPAISPDGSRVVFQQMPRFDWELYMVKAPAEMPVRITREIQHDLLPRFIDDHRVLALVGEARHRRSYLHDVDALTTTRLFHNNTVRTIAPEYEWAVSPDATRVLVVAERDGDTVTPHRHLWLVDMRREVTVPELRTRIADNLSAERSLRAEGTRRFAPISAAVRDAVAQVSTDRIFRYEKALFDFDSKHVTQPGNLKAREYLLGQYKSFGYDARFQPFDAMSGPNRSAIPTANVLAVLKGTENPELVYVVSSHFDSRAEGPGADDNTSGTAALLEAARVLRTRPQAATIIFASFTGEEAGLLGSREFVKQAKADGLKFVGALNNDMLGWANDNRLDNTIRYSNAGIRDIQHAAAFLFTRMITYDAFYYKSTDAAAFYDGYGDIVGGIGSYPVLGNPHYHQPHDLLEFENHQLIAEASKTTIATLMLLASSPSRIAGLKANGTSATWTPSPEKGITKYLVRYGPKEAPNRWQLEVTTPRAVLPNAKAGMVVAVKAVNQRGLEGWDWARTTIE